MSRLLPVVLAGLLAILLTGCRQPEAIDASSAVIQSTEPLQVAFLPRPDEARLDTGDLYARGCGSNYEDDVVHPCVFDHSTTAVSPVVVAAGDSKTAQWVPALQVLAKKHHWRLITMTKSGCPFSDIRRSQGKQEEYTSCVTWNRSAVSQILELSPDLLITTQLEFYATRRDGKRLQGAENREELVRGLSDRITLMQTAGIPVATIAETPRMTIDAAACAGSHPDDLPLCAQPRFEALGNAGVVAAAALRSGATHVDLTSRFCTSMTCPAVRNGLLVYRDDHHVTATFARSLAPNLEAALAARLGVALGTRLFSGCAATATSPAATASAAALIPSAASNAAALSTTASPPASSPAASSPAASSPAARQNPQLPPPRCLDPSR